MKRILLLFTLLVLLSASCGKNENPPVTDVPAIDFTYEGDIVLNTPEYLVTESEDNFILYEMETGKRLRKFLDFGEVKYEENGEIKSQYVFLQKTFAYILKDGTLETRDFNFSYNEVAVEGNYILLNRSLFDGNLNGTAHSLRGEILSQDAFEDGARLTAWNNDYDLKSEFVRVMQCETKPENLVEIYKADESTLYFKDSESGFILEKSGEFYKLSFSVSGEIIDASGNGIFDVHILYRDNGQLKNCWIIGPLNVGDLPEYIRADIKEVSLNDGFHGMTVSTPWILDENGEILLCGEQIWTGGDVLATHYPNYVYETDRVEYIINSTEPIDEITLYDKNLTPINSSPAEIFHISGEDRYLSLFDRDTKKFWIVSNNGDIVYQTDHIERPLVFDSFGTAVLTKTGKVQFITYDGKALEELDGWSEEFTLYTPRQNYVYEDNNPGEELKVKYWRVIFDDPNDDDSQYVIFRYFPDTGICDTVREPILTN